MTDILSSSALLLVCITPSPRDLEIARLFGWYRIPLRFSPKVIDVDYLAFYQTAAFGADHQWCIESFAEVRGHELTTRSQLFHDEPNHPRANEEYYKIQLGELIILPQPIIAKEWKRLTFLYTTGELFSKARTLHDLVVGVEERRDLWRALCERARREEEYHTGNDQELNLDLDPSLLAFLGNSDLFYNQNSPANP